jgi:hypothetical protein
VRTKSIQDIRGDKAEYKITKHRREIKTSADLGYNREWKLGYSKLNTN